VLYYPKHNIFI